MFRQNTVFWFIAAVTVLAIYIDLPRFHLEFHQGPVNISQDVGGYNLDVGLFGFRFRRGLEIKKGLDLQGGLRVTLEAKTSDIDPADKKAAIESARNIIERRVNLYGVSEPNVYTLSVGKSDRIVVELPGVENTREALSLIGQTAQLDFREQKNEKGTDKSEAPSQQGAPFVKTNLTGKDLKRAQVVFGQTGEPQVQLVFNSEGAKKFEEITRRNVGQPLAIFLDDQVLTAPTVQQVITGGDAVISGRFSIDEARNLVIQLNAGALPVPIKVLQQENISATLGQTSVQQSIKAGMVGLLLVAIFMILYYGRLGILATLALVVYGLITLALYKLIPVTLTLSGIAGFILSIGMAVDSNILIFERMKEELRAGKPLKGAMELGFGRAWDSIRDANVATLITTFILFNPFDWQFLVTSGMVRGFALTLGLGILISLFTGIVVTRTLIRVLYK